MSTVKSSKGVASDADQPQQEGTALLSRVNLARNQRVYDVCQSIMTLAIGQCNRHFQGSVRHNHISADENANVVPRGAWMQCGSLAARLTWPACVLLRNFHIVKLLWVVAMEAIITAAAILQPRWYHQGGKTVLLVVVRPATLAFLVLELLLAPPPPIQPFATRVFFLGSKGLMLLLFGILCQFQAQLDFRMACTSWLLLLLCSTLISWPCGQLIQQHSSTARVIHLLVGACCLALLAGMCLRRTKARQGSSAPAGDDAVVDELQACGSEEEQRDAADKEQLAVEGHPSPEDRGPPPPSPQPRTANTKPRKRLYKRHDFCHVQFVSVKIKHHAAFEARAEISATVEQRLRTCCGNGDAGGGGCEPGGDGGDGGDGSGQLSVISTVAIPGCLQLLMAVTNMQRAPPPDPSGPHGGLSLVRNVYEGLPPACRTADVTVQVGEVVCRFGPTGLARGGALAEQGGHVRHPGAGDSGPPLGAVQRVEALLLGACCVQSGLAEAQEVDVQLPGSCVAGGLQLVACARAGGVEVHAVKDVAGASETCRLTLPPGLDPGPMALHAVSTEPGREGLLLASCCTVALPRPATQELRQLLRDCADNGGSLRSDLGHMLADLAACWKVEGSSGEPAPAHAHLLRYFARNNLGGCKAALEAQMQALREAAAAAQQQQQQQAADAAAAAAAAAAQCSAAASKPAAPGGDDAADARRQEGSGGAWAHLQSRRTSLVSALVFAAAVAAAYRKLRQSSQGEALANAGIVAHLALVVGPHLLVAFGGAAVRRRRNVVMLLHTAGKSALHLLALASPTLVADWIGAEFRVQMMMMEGLLRPALNQVPWRLQLVMSACEEVSKITSCYIGSEAFGRTTCVCSGPAFHAAMLATACAVSYLVQRLSVASTRAPPRQSTAGAVRPKSE